MFLDVIHSHLFSSQYRPFFQISNVGPYFRE